MILTSTIALIILAFLIALLVVYFQYFFNEKKIKETNTLAILRFISVFSIIVLLINPKIQQKILETVKPKLLVAVDNSSSILYSNQDSIVELLVKKINENPELRDKFEIDNFTFGSSVQNNSNLNFQDSQTNINDVLSSLNSISKQQIAPIILISDGNQTYGNDYKYYQSKQAVYPIIIGDTTQISDIEINRINVNSYSFLDNKFPVEVFIQYTGNGIVETNYIIEESNKLIYKQSISLSKKNNNVRLQFNLPANKVGKHSYISRIEPFNGEKNTINNNYIFSVEIIDEQTSVAIVYDFIHPDIGMLKRSIESNKQREVNLIHVKNIVEYSADIDLFILYQPNDKFNEIFNEINSLDKNYFVITGKQTDWNFLNIAQNSFKKNTLSSTEEYYANYNTEFDKFQIDDIGFSEFPPLEDYFGDIRFTNAYESILTQSIRGISTQSPLLAIFTHRERRGVALFGENIWKWRALSYTSDRTFEKFDQFMNSIIQFLTIPKKTNPIDIDYNPFYYTDEPIKITAKIYDSNFNFDANNPLELIFQGSNEKRPFYLNGTIYELNLNDLQSGDYSFTVSNAQNNKRVNGLFTVIDYSVEQQKSQANKNDLSILANNSGGKTFYPNQMEDLYQYILKNENLVSIQKIKIKTTSLIDWKWLLGLIVLSLSLEWFIRKYRGLI